MAEYFCYLAYSRSSWFLNESQLVMACGALSLSRYVLRLVPIFPADWRTKTELSPLDVLPCVRELFGMVTLERETTAPIRELFSKEKVSFMIYLLTCII